MIGPGQNGNNGIVSQQNLLTVQLGEYALLSWGVTMATYNWHDIVKGVWVNSKYYCSFSTHFTGLTATRGH